MSLEDLLNRHDILYEFWCSSFKKIWDKRAHQKNVREYNNIKVKMSDIQTIKVSIPFCDVSFNMELTNEGHNVSFYNIVKGNEIYESETTKFICETLK